MIARGLVSVAALLGFSFAAQADDNPANWTMKDITIASPHPYTDFYKMQFDVKVEGATKISLYFPKCSSETNYDYVIFSDAAGNVVGQWDGNHDGQYSPVVNGDTINVKFTSDQSVGDYGFDISKAAYVLRTE